MITKARFNKDTDIQETIPDLEISISMAMQTGIVKDTATSTPYTNETEVDNVGNYLHDNIEVAMALKNLGESMTAMPTSQTVNPQGE